MNSTLAIPMDKSAAPPATPESQTATQPERIAFTILVRQHHRSFLAYARALLPDDASCRDLVQDALITAFKKLHTFETDGDFPAWVRGIIRNKWRELARVKKCEPLSDEVLEGLEAQHSLWQHDQAEAQAKNGLFIKLESCLSRLPEQLRSAIHSTYYESRNSEEAATQLGTSAVALRKRLERARQALRLCLETAQA
jgi:RNA polymerase sigma factor (sigma-70 family)